MTMPPPPDSPESRWPPPDEPPDPHQPPQSWYPPGQQPGAWPGAGYPPPFPPYPYHGQLSPPPRSSGETIAAVFVGMVIYAAINVVVGPIVLWGLANAISTKAAFLIGAITLGAITFGGGTALIARSRRQPWPKGIGIGLMIGWALTSILTAGFCTGLNPTMYTWR